MSRDRFYEKAKELLTCEVEMTATNAEYQDLLDDWALAGQIAKLSAPAVQKKNLITALVSLSVGVAAVVLLALFGDGRYLTLLFGLLLVLGLTVSYFAFVDFRRNKADYKDASETDKELGVRVKATKQTLSGAQETRERLVGELNRMREEDPSLAGRYWWDTGLTPVSKLQLPGDVSLLDEKLHVEYELAHEVTVHEKEGRLYCENIFSYGGNAYTPDIVDTLLHSDDMAVLYHNDDVIRREKTGYAMLPLYAILQSALQEIEASTRTVSNVAEKEREMQEYREKLDSYETMINGVINREGFVTNEDAALMGHRTMEEYLSESSVRALFEDEKQRLIDKRPDQEEQTTYSRVFNNLYANRYVTCAYVLIPLDPALEERTAMILLPLTDMPAIDMTVRTASSKETYEGYLEEYCGNEAFGVVQVTRQCITLAVDNLFDPQVKAFLKLKPRDILEEKPKGLTDDEWVYLLWHDGQ